jgi:hypothetical protein
MIRAALSVVTTIGLLAGTLNLVTNAHREESVKEIEAQGEVLDQKFDGCKRFTAELNLILARVAEEDLPLMDAIELIIQASENYYPQYLKQVNFLSAGGNVKHRISETIINFMVHATRRDKSMAHVLDRLKNEQASLFSATSSRT